MAATRSSVVVRIQAHPSRRGLWPALCESVTPLPVEVSEHASEPPNPWEGYQLALQSGLDDPSRPTHVLVLQDDVEVCSHFAEVTQLIADRNTDIPVSLFLSWLPPAVRIEAMMAAKRGECYVSYGTGQAWAPVLGVLWPVAAAERFLSWARSYEKLPGWPNMVASDDAVLGEWIKRCQERFLITVPSLVEHPDRVDSIIGKRAQWGKDKARVAANYVGDRDPLAYKW